MCRILLHVILSTIIGSVGYGQIALTGNVFDGSGGPLQSGTVYTVGTSITVPAGQTLTVQADAVVKFSAGAVATVVGTMNVTASSSNPAVLTSILDDSFGGDTNGDGAATSPSPGDWNALICGVNSDASFLTGLVVRYAGSSVNAAIELQAADVTLVDCLVEHCAKEALDLGGNSFPSVSGCRLENNTGAAVRQVRLDAVPGFANNTAVGNGGGNHLDVTLATITGASTITASNVLGGALVLSANINLNPGSSLTLGSGVVIKFSGNRVFDCSGTLIVNGTVGTPAVLTSFEDDAFGGDTNGDGASMGTPGSWNALLLRGSASASTITGLWVRHAGSGSNASVHLLGNSATLVGCVVERGGNDALDLSSTSSPTVTGCSFLDCAGLAVDGVRLQDVPGFSACTASGNAGNYAEISSSALNVSTTITQDDVVGGALVLEGSVTLNAPLNIQPGVIIKFRAGELLDVRAPLTAIGTTGNRVVLTSFEDDSAGGDTNNDGPSTGTPGSWNALVFSSGATGSLLDVVTVRFSGAASSGAVDLSLSDITMNRCIVADSGGSGLDLSNNSTATVTNCQFDDNARPISGVTLAALAGFRHNTAVGNTLGDHIRITSTALPAGTRVDAFNYPGEVLVVGVNLIISTVSDLTLGPGVVIKMDGNLVLDVQGRLDVEGDGFAPVVITSMKDDVVGGDTNVDGNATMAAPGDWSRILLRNSSTGFIDSLRLRYGGSSNAALDADVTGARIRNLRVDHSATDGVEIAGHVGSMENWICFSCAGAGIDVDGNGLQIVGATVVGCGGPGIDRTQPTTGTVVNSIAWNNAGGGLVGYGAGDVLNCDADPAFAGMNGNISADPLFVDETGGDLRLGAGSPCIGAADSVAAFPLVTDSEGFSRLLDDDLDGLPFADIGAHERALYATTVTGTPRMGTTMTFGADTIGGPGGFAILIVGVLDGFDLVIPYGLITVGTLATILPGPQIALGESIIANLPFDPGLDGFRFSVQSFCLVSGNPFVGQITNRYIGTLRL